MSDHSSDSASLQAQVRSLRGLLTGLLAVTFILSMGLNILMFTQVRALRTSVSEGLPQVEATAKAYAEGEGRLTQSLINELIVFSKTNPDINPILTHYKLTTGGAPSLPTTTNSAPAGQ